MFDYNGQPNWAVYLINQCGHRYIGFFPDARRDNLLIGVIHAFQYIEMLRFILNNNEKSVVLHHSRTLAENRSLVNIQVNMQVDIGADNI